MLKLLIGMTFVLGILPGIGPQNLNTLSHAIKKNHHYLVAATCVISDCLLILIGGVGLKLFNSQTVILLVNITGIIFISCYLIIKIKGLFSIHKKHKISNHADNIKTSITRALILTWLNPLVCMDTIVIVGGASSHYYQLDWFMFILGTILGDIIWIYGLVFVASKLSYKLNKPSIWVSLDIFTICIMTYILYKTIILVLH